MKFVVAVTLLLTTAACQSGREGGADLSAATVRWPSTLRVFGDGYPNRGDPCRGLGESPAVSDYLDHNDRLLGCPTRADALRLGGDIVGQEGDIVLVSVPAPGP